MTESQKQKHHPPSGPKFFKIHKPNMTGGRQDCCIRSIFGCGALAKEAPVRLWPIYLSHHLANGCWSWKCCHAYHPVGASEASVALFPLGGAVLVEPIEAEEGVIWQMSVGSVGLAGWFKGGAGDVHPVVSVRMVGFTSLLLPKYEPHDQVAMVKKWVQGGHLRDMYIIKSDLQAICGW